MMQFCWSVMMDISSSKAAINPCFVNGVCTALLVTNPLLTADFVFLFRYAVLGGLYGVVVRVPAHQSR